jgi:hypothetical protein
MRSATLVLVLPQVLRSFSGAEAATWFVFSAVISVQGVLGFGFSPSFARLLAYARAGAATERMRDLRDGRAITVVNGINWESVDRLCSCMRRVFLALALCSLAITASLGTLAVRRPIEAINDDFGAAWLAWGIITIGSSLSFWNVYYVSYLQGMDRLAEWRRFETVTSLVAIGLSTITLALGGGLLHLVIANQACGASSVLAFRYLCRQIDGGKFKGLGQRPWEASVFSLVWDSAWKTGITNVLSYGLIQSTGVIQAQFSTAPDTATYNFTLRVVTVISQVVQAPFLTKLPELARLRALGDLNGQLQLIRRGMRWTHWSTAAAVMLGAITTPLLLRMIETQSVVFDPVLWSLFGLTIFFDRHGGMLNQIRNLTNQPLEHFGIIGYFIVNVLLMATLHDSLGMYTFPLAMLGTQLLFSLWFSAYAAYPVITARPLAFERTVSIPPFLMLVAYTLISNYGKGLWGW